MLKDRIIASLAELGHYHSLKQSSAFYAMILSSHLCFLQYSRRELNSFPEYKGALERRPIRELCSFGYKGDLVKKNTKPLMLMIKNK
jgi:hypothetical protein